MNFELNELLNFAEPNIIPIDVLSKITKSQNHKAFWPRPREVQNELNELLNFRTTLGDDPSAT